MLSSLVNQPRKLGDFQPNIDNKRDRLGGGRGIRTPERVTPLTVFKTAAFNHSAIPPTSKLPDLARAAQLVRHGVNDVTSARCLGPYRFIGLSSRKTHSAPP